jgi:hypothetical protein
MAGYISKKDLHKKNYKRYLRRYRLQFQKLGYTVLPERYHTRCLKRRVEVKRWACSKILQGNVVSVPEDCVGYDDIRELDSECYHIQLDFAKVYFNVDYEKIQAPDIKDLRNQMLFKIRHYEKNLIFRYYT